MLSFLDAMSRLSDALLPTTIASHLHFLPRRRRARDSTLPLPSSPSEPLPQPLPRLISTLAVHHRRENGVESGSRSGDTELEPSRVGECPSAAGARRESSNGGSLPAVLLSRVDADADLKRDGRMEEGDCSPPNIHGYSSAFNRLQLQSSGTTDRKSVV